MEEEEELAAPFAESEAVSHEPVFDPAGISAVIHEEAAHNHSPVEASPEVAAVEELPQASETEFFEDSEEDEAANGPRGFAPGAGTIEEEIIEEEEYDFEPIRAHGDEHDPRRSWKKRPSITWQARSSARWCATPTLNSALALRPTE